MKSGKESRLGNEKRKEVNKMEKVLMVRELFEKYLVENDVDVNSEHFETLLDVTYNETMEYFANYEEFYNFYTANL